VNHGRIFLNLYDHEVNWEMWAIGHIEPVETTIVEIADLRNQRMDDVILMLDPVIKIRKDSGISKNDIIFAPGAKWELRKMDDVVVERLPDISLMGVNEERMLHDEIEKTLAISEYVQGVASIRRRTGWKSRNADRSEQFASQYIRTKIFRKRLLDWPIFSLNESRIH